MSPLDAAAAALAIALAAPAFAEEPAPQPCCTAAIVPAGFLEVEANYSGDAVRAGLVHTSNLTLKYSLTDRLQLQLATSNFFVGGAQLSPRMVDGVAPAVKWVFNEPGEVVPLLALSVHGCFPTLSAADALQTTVDAQATAYASRDFGPLHVDLTASLLVAGLGAAPVPQGSASLAGTLALEHGWALASGAYSSFGNADRLPVDGGLWASANFAPVARVALSAGAELGLFQQTRSFSVFVGLAVVTGPDAEALAQVAPAQFMADVRGE